VSLNFYTSANEYTEAKMNLIKFLELISNCYDFLESTEVSHKKIT
jgi:hypothetical protein